MQFGFIWVHWFIAEIERVYEIRNGGVNQYNKEVTSSGIENTKNKSETISEMGYSKDQASDYQRMAQNPAIVNLVIEQAEREGISTQVLLPKGWKKQNPKPKSPKKWDTHSKRLYHLQ